MKEFILFFLLLFFNSISTYGNILFQRKKETLIIYKKQINISIAIIASSLFLILIYFVFSKYFTLYYFSKEISLGSYIILFTMYLLFSMLLGSFESILYIINKDNFIIDDNIIKSSKKRLKETSDKLKFNLENNIHTLIQLSKYLENSKSKVENYKKSNFFYFISFKIGEMFFSIDKYVDLPFEIKILTITLNESELKIDGHLGTPYRDAIDAICTGRRQDIMIALNNILTIKNNSINQLNEIKTIAHPPIKLSLFLYNSVMRMLDSDPEYFKPLKSISRFLLLLHILVRFLFLGTGLALVLNYLIN